MKKTELWQRICEFELDDPNAEMKFSDKLCKEENWSEPFTALAISEYKKFIYLCAVLPNGASPSPIVDKVWHLHLTYTDNYWNQFCKKTLGKDIHHFPSKGGRNEDLKHLDWYSDTIKHYINEFGEIPPANIWKVEQRGEFEQYLPTQSPFRKPFYDEIGSVFESAFVKKALLACSLAFVALLVLVGNPYKLSGHAFLGFYAVLMLIGFALSFVQKSYTGMLADTLVRQLHALHFSLVFKNIETTMKMMIVNLLEKKYLIYEYNSFRHVFDKGEPLFYGIQAHENETIAIKNIRKILFAQIDYFRTLVAPIKQKINLNKSVFYVFHGIIMLVNVIRIFKGVANNKPVGFLIVFLIAYPILVYFISGFNVSNQPSVQQAMEIKSTDDGFAIVAATFLFTNFYLMSGNAGLHSAMTPLGDNKKWVDTTSSSCGSTCSSDGGSGGGDGCSSGCGGCGGGD